MSSSLETLFSMRSSGLLETSCGYLLQELEMIWDEVGEDKLEKEKALLAIQQDCLEVYQRKVNSANVTRARLHQELAGSEAEFTHLFLSLGERSIPSRPEKMKGTLKEQLDSITPALREMQQRKRVRVNRFRAVQGKIKKVTAEIAGYSEHGESSVIVDENDLSLKKLDEYQIELQRLLNEKSDRLESVENYITDIRNVSAILGMDASMIITKVHASLNELSGLSKNISDNILAKLNSRLESLEEEKQKRLQKLQRLGKSLMGLLNLMNTPDEERQMFSNIATLLSVSATEISDPESLTLDIIEKAEAEVERLDQLKATKMKELLQEKQIELEEICKRSHMEVPIRSEMENRINHKNSGDIDHADLIRSMDEQIPKAKEEAHSRKSILEKVEKWIQASDEERWLEEYSMDQNRYRVSRGAHKNLKRAERARVTVNKIPGLLDSLIAKLKSWEEDRRKVFLYDEVPLLAKLEEYESNRQDREEEKQRQREKKKAPGQVVIAQENQYLSRPSTSASISSRRPSNQSFNGSFSRSIPQNRKIPQGMQQLGARSINSPAQGSTSYEKEGRMAKGCNYFGQRCLPVHLKEETASVVSTFSGPLSP